MAEMYDQKKKDELCFHAMTLFYEAIKKVKTNGDAGAVFTICLAMCLEPADDEEDVREVLHTVARNCLGVWREYKELKIRFGLEK